MRRRTIALLVLAASCTTTNAPVPQMKIMTRLQLTADGAPVALASAIVDASVTHGVATTRLELTFRNDRERTLEGELLVPLPEGASLVEFALEVDGTMREATLVERECAREAFESVERRGVDPGLVEWSHGNTFRARVYPIPAHGTKRARVVFEQEVSDRLNVDLGVPLTGTVTVDGEVKRVDGSIDVALAPLTAPDGTVDERGAFVARIPLRPAPRREPPRTAVVVYDASLGGLERDRRAERELLGRLLAKASDIRLVTFAHEVLSDQRFTSASEVVARLETTEPDGASRLACLDLASLRKGADAVYLVTDGIAALGGEAVPGEGKTTSIVSGLAADRAALGRLGRLVDLRALGVAEAERRTLSLPRELLVVRGGSALQAAGSPIFGDVLTVCGETRAREIEVWIGEDREAYPVRMTLKHGVGASRFLARKKIEAMLAAPSVDVAAVVSLAKAEKIVTPFTSFVVLESVADDARFGIEPENAEMAKLVAQEQSRRELLQEAAKRDRGMPAPELGLPQRRDEPGTATAQSHENHEVERVELQIQERVSEVENSYVPTNKVVEFPEDSHWRERVGRRRVGIPATDDAPRAFKAKTTFTARRDEVPVHLGAIANVAINVDLERLPQEGRHWRDESEHATPGFPGPRARLVTRHDELTFDDDDQGFFTKIHPEKSSPSSIATLASTSTSDLDAAYFAHRTLDPAFFTAASDLYLARGLRARAIRVLTNVAALDPGDPVLLRVLAYRLQEADASELALSVLERVAKLRPEEPQSFRDLALAEADLANVASATANLARVVTQPHENRFPEIEKIAARELERLTFPSLVAADLRVVLTWDANDCDVGLWVTEPSGEKVYYSHPVSASFGHLSHDFTQGYGPEEFVLEDAPPGEYLIEANFFGDRRQTARTETTIRATIFTDYGRPTERRAVVVRRLTDRKEVVSLARVTMAR